MVSAIGLGCMSFGGAFGPTTKEASFRCLDAAYDHGLTFLDTANIYGMGLSETTLGEWPGLHKSNISIATKASIINGPPRRFDNSENHLRTELESSLKRLGVDHVDLFYIHRREETRPIEEVVGTLSRLIKAGLIGGLAGGVIIWIYEAIVWVGVQHLMPMQGIPANATGLVFGKAVQASLGPLSYVVGTSIHFFFSMAWGVGFALIWPYFRKRGVEATLVALLYAVIAWIVMHLAIIVAVDVHPDYTDPAVVIGGFMSHFFFTVPLALIVKHYDAKDRA